MVAQFSTGILAHFSISIYSRYEIAKSMLPVVRSNSSGIMSIKQVARLAVDYADALIEELKGGNRETEESLQSR